MFTAKLLFASIAIEDGAFRITHFLRIFILHLPRSRRLLLHLPHFNILLMLE